MAYTTLEQGGSRINFDNLDPTTANGIIANFGQFDSVELEYKIGNKTVLKYKWPQTTGFKEFVVSGGKYYFNILATESINMLGLYSIEYAYKYNSTGLVIKGTINDYLLVNQEGV